MTESSQAIPTSRYEAKLRGGVAFFRSLVIALTAFLTLVDLFSRRRRSCPRSPDITA
jgi:hypothetical protein